MKLGIHGKEFGTEITDFIQHVFNELHSLGWDLVISDIYMPILVEHGIETFTQETYVSRQSMDGIQMLVTLGGDGTLLEAVTHVGSMEIPILGINTGRLGFLATISRDEFDAAIQKIDSGEYTLEERTLLRLETENNLFGDLNFALNDVAIMKKDTSSMITVHASINGEFLNSYWADGIVISTPTGSTGYSISCGGPVVVPGSQNFIITPVSPHNLTVRPIVVPDTSRLDFTIEGRSKNFLVSLDSRYETVDDSVELRIVQESFKAKLVKIEGTSYFRTLRHKLNWGLDARN